MAYSWLFISLDSGFCVREDTPFCRLVTTGTLQFIIIYPLSFQNSLRTYGIKGQVSKTAYAYHERQLDAQQPLIGQNTLEQADKTAAHDHHDQKARAGIGMFA